MTDEEAQGVVPMKRMNLRYAGVCRLCGTELPPRADAIYERTTKTVRFVDCGQAPTTK